MKLYVSVAFKKCGNVGFRPVGSYQLPSAWNRQEGKLIIIPAV